MRFDIPNNLIFPTRGYVYNYFIEYELVSSSTATTEVSQREGIELYRRKSYWGALLTTAPDLVIFHHVHICMLAYYPVS